MRFGGSTLGQQHTRQINVPLTVLSFHPVLLDFNIVCIPLFYDDSFYFGKQKQMHFSSIFSPKLQNTLHKNAYICAVHVWYRSLSLVLYYI